MSDRLNVGILNPVVLTFVETGLDGREIALEARAANGDRVCVAASRERWHDLFRAAMGGGIARSQEAVVRDMFVRGEIEVEDFEREIGARP